MTASQYKKVIECSIYLNKGKNDAPLIMARKFFNNLGVALPQGDFKKILSILKNDTYMGWRHCTRDEAEKFAEIGVPTMAIDEEKLLIIKPSAKIPDFSAYPELSKVESPIVKYASEINSSNSEKTMSYFAYCYGRKLEEYKK